MQLNQLKYLLVLSKAGSYLEAAKQLNVSQSTISMAIKNLQDELGYQIVQRTSKGLTFTEKGQILLEKVNLIDIETQKLMKIKDSLYNDMAGSVHIAGASYGQILQLVDLIVLLQKRYPEIQFHLDDRSNMRIIDGVCQGKYLAGFLQLNSIDDFYFQGLIAKNDLEFDVLERGNMCFATGPNFPLLHKEDVELKDFLQATVITSRYQMTDYFLDYLRQRGYDKKITVMNDIYTSRKMINQSEFYSSFLPEFGMEDSSTIGNLHIIPLKDFDCSYTFGLIYRKNALLHRERELIYLIKNSWYLMKDGGNNETEAT